MLFNDAGSWTDVYWQSSANEKHARKNTNTAEWMLKSKAIQDRGRGQTGETAIDEAVAAGVYEKRVIFQGKEKCSKPFCISQIRVKGGKSDQMHTTTLEDRVRVSCAATSDDFKQRLSNGLFNAVMTGVSIAHRKRRPWQLETMRRQCAVICR